MRHDKTLDQILNGEDLLEERDHVGIQLEGYMRSYLGADDKDVAVTWFDSDEAPVRFVMKVTHAVGYGDDYRINAGAHIPGAPKPVFGAVLAALRHAGLGVGSLLTIDQEHGEDEPWWVQPCKLSVWSNGDKPDERGCAVWNFVGCDGHCGQSLPWPDVVHISLSGFESREEVVNAAERLVESLRTFAAAHALEAAPVVRKASRPVDGGETLIRVGRIKGIA